MMYFVLVLVLVLVLEKTKTIQSEFGLIVLGWVWMCLKVEH